MDRVFQFLNNHFEDLLAVNIFWLIGTITVILIARIRSIDRNEIVLFFREVLSYGLIAGQALLFILTLSIFISEIQKRDISLDEEFSDKIEPITDWVKDQVTIYFVKDKNLVTIKADGTKQRVIFTAEDQIKEYHFSPDGRYLGLITENNLYLLDRPHQKAELVDTIKKPSLAGDSQFKGVINGVRFDPVSQKFCYRLALWSSYSSLDRWFIYDIKSKEKKIIKSPTRRIPSLRWDQSGENLYYAWFDALDTTIHGNPFEVRIFKIPLTTLEPELILKFLYKEGKLPLDNLALRNINLFVEDKQLAFGRVGLKDDPIESQKGFKVKIDSDDQMYFSRKSPLRSRIYKLLHIPEEGDIPINPYKEERFALKSLKWLLTLGQEGGYPISWSPLSSSRVGIDEKDHLYYIPNRWWRKRLFKIPRATMKNDMPRFQYKGGELAVQDLRWLPSGRYVIMEHYLFGILILDPSTGRIGILVSEKGSSFGWYPYE